MNEKKIAFITCVNDDLEYAECRFYLERIVVPKGYEKDLITIQEAPSMTAGYNAGMQNSDAKYKVYLHQDVFIKNQNFIADMLKIFAMDEIIGLMGMVGSTDIGTDAVAVAAWNVGKIYDNCASAVRIVDFENCKEVQAVDGLLIATQYDIPWREDIFDGWDFYDISQCMEFRKRGYKVVVPYQEQAWCYHDNGYSKMLRYEKYRKKFIETYLDIDSFVMTERSEDLLKYEQAKENARTEIAALIRAGAKQELRELFSNSSFQGFMYLREYEVISQVNRLEEENDSSVRFWNDTDSLEDLLHKLCVLKFAIKRIEFGVEQTIEDRRFLEKNFSQYAIQCVCNWYIKSEHI